MAVRPPRDSSLTDLHHARRLFLTLPPQEARDYVGEKATAAKETLTGKAHETGQAASDTASSAKEYAQEKAQQASGKMEEAKGQAQAKANQ